MSASIDVSTSVTKYGDGIGAWKLDMSVTSTTDISSGVFIYQVHNPVFPETEAVAEFSNVATMAQLEDLPVDDPGDSIYFRKDSVSLVFPNQTQCKLVMDRVLSDIRYLVHQVNNPATSTQTVHIS